MQFRKAPSNVKDALSVLFQVSDVEKILGVVQTENIQVTAEAYDVALEIIPGTNWKNLHFMSRSNLMCAFLI